MSDNCGAIFVKAAKGIVEEVEKYWRGKGAKPDGKNPLDLKPLGIGTKKSKRLGIAVAPVENGWVGVRDSERYTADFSLAKHLSQSLKAKVVWLTLYGATDGAELRILEKGKETAERDVEKAMTRLKLPDPTMYFEDLRSMKLKGWTLLSLKPVTQAKYDTGPEPEDGEDDEEDLKDAGPLLGALFTKLIRHVRLSDAEWEKIEALDSKYDPRIPILGLRAIKEGESRSWVFSYLAAKAVKTKNLELFRTLLDKSPSTKKDPINQTSLMRSLGLWLSYQLYKGPIPPDWHPSVQTWIKAALPFAARDESIHVAVAEAYARIGADEKAREHVRLAIKNGAFHGHGLDKDPMIAPLLKKKPFADEVAALLAKST